MRYRVWFSVVAVMLLICVYTYADVPRLINFQGRLTDASGKFVTDGNYSLTFRIYSDSTGGSSKWSEAQLVNVSKGLFNVILGSVTPIPDSIFEYSNAFLGIQVAADPEMTPRQRLSSLGYAYRGEKADTSNYSKDSDKLDGLHASDFTSPVSDYGRSGVTSNLYEDAATLTSKYVNSAGPDSVYASSGTAFLGTISGSSPVEMYGIRGYANNTSTGYAYGGFFTTSSSGSGGHFGIRGEGWSSSSGQTHGISGYSSNSGSGPVYGGSFFAGSPGTGSHYAVLGQAYGSSPSETYGMYGYSTASSSGDAYGGYFLSSSAGTGAHYGAYVEGNGNSSSPTYGSFGFASNLSSGNVYGGYFQADSAGTGSKYGVNTRGYGNKSDGIYGTYSYAQNTSSGTVTGGYFSTSSSGTGTHYGLRAYGYGNSATYGIYSAAYNYSDDAAYAGYFYTSSTGTGKRYGVRAYSYGASDSTTYGVYGYGSNSSAGDAYGGFFETSSSGTGNHYGVRGEGNAASVYSANGVLGYAENTSNGQANGGWFTSSNAGTGLRRGVYAAGNSASSSSAFGIESYGVNTSTGITYAGYFYAESYGTGTKYGVWSYASSSEGYAGYFWGNTLTTGTKSAAVKVDNGEYRLLYAMESPENWFEDFGGGTLQNGVATVQIDPLFAQAANTLLEYRVYLTPEGDCRGLYVTNKTTNSFEIRELQNGTSNISFSYRIVAKRKGYEDIRLAKMMGQTPEEMQAEQAKRQADTERERASMKRHGQELQEKPPANPEMTEAENPRKVRREEVKFDTEKTRVVSEE